jgi:hypothetical protein
MSFTWVPFYKELALKLTAYRTNSGELAQLLTSMLQEQGLEADWLRDKDEQSQFHALTEIDPFTFFAAFNRGISKDNRSGILQKLRGRFALTTVLPDDFNGIPTLANRNSWFVSYRPDRATDDIDNLLFGLFNREFEVPIAVAKRLQCFCFDLQDQLSNPPIPDQQSPWLPGRVHAKPVPCKRQ